MPETSVKSGKHPEKSNKYPPNFPTKSHSNSMGSHHLFSIKLNIIVTVKPRPLLIPYTKTATNAGLYTDVYECILAPVDDILHLLYQLHHSFGNEKPVRKILRITQKSFQEFYGRAKYRTTRTKSPSAKAEPRQA